MEYASFMNIWWTYFDIQHSYYQTLQAYTYQSRPWCHQHDYSSSSIADGKIQSSKVAICKAPPKGSQCALSYTRLGTVSQSRRTLHPPVENLRNLRLCRRGPRTTLLAAHGVLC